eukprot:COSAG02_NODE_43784_length_371_cov_2.062500_1_plen_62_part_01
MDWWEQHGAKLILRVQKKWKSQAAGVVRLDRRQFGRHAPELRTKHRLAAPRRAGVCGVCGVC